MRLSINAPATKELGMIELLFDFHLILSRYLKNANYRMLTESLVNRGDFVMLDNYDEKRKDITDDETLIKDAIDLKVNEIIVPDVLGDSKKTFENFERFSEKYALLLLKNNIHLVGVVHGKTVEEYLLAFQQLFQYPHCACLAIPDELGVYFAGGRMEFLSEIKRQNYDFKPIHMLGVWENPIEIKNLARQGIARSLDTTSPIWMALCGKYFSYKDGATGKLPKSNPDDYFLAKDTLNIRMMHNLGCAKRWSENNGKS